MVERAPDLIRRAAARLRQSGLHSRPDTSLHEGVRNDEAPSQGVDLLGEVGLGPVQRPRPSQQRLVNISSTSLAERGIQLPSSNTSRTLQEFRVLRREVLAGVARTKGTLGDNARVVLVTSANVGEGKTFTAINLGLALAYEKSTRVLLMDGDAYRQSMLAYLGISADRGWLDVVAGPLVDSGEVILRTNIPNVSVLPAGKERPEIPELISSVRMGEFLGELAREDEARIIVIDSVPCLASTEPSLLAGLAGQTLFVVAAHQTGRNEIDTSLRLLKTSPNVNLVLNKAHPALAEQFKGYGYSYTYGPEQ